MCAVAFLLGSCGPSERSGEGPHLALLDEKLTAPCEGPVALPDRDLTTEDVATFWGSDRRRLVKCRDTHGALSKVVTTERAALTNPKE